MMLAEKINIDRLSENYKVRRLTADDVELIYELCVGNPLYYEYYPPMVTKESILKDLVSLPPKVRIDDKYLIGYFDSDKLITVMDLIDGYPDKKTAFIGFFMINKCVHNKGIGSKIIHDLEKYLKASNYSSIRLGWAKENPQAEQFWIKMVSWR